MILSVVNFNVMHSFTECITLTQREQKRLQVVAKLDRGELRVQEAAGVLGLSVRQVWRVRAAGRGRGAWPTGTGEQQPVHALPQAVRGRVVELARSAAYRGCNDTQFTEFLAEREELPLSRETVRRACGRRGCPVRADGGRHGTTAGGSACPNRGCCCNWMAAPTSGWKGAGPG